MKGWWLSLIWLMGTLLQASPFLPIAPPKRGWTPVNIVFRQARDCAGARKYLRGLPILLNCREQEPKHYSFMGTYTGKRDAEVLMKRLRRESAIEIAVVPGTRAVPKLQLSATR